MIDNAKTLVKVKNVLKPVIALLIFGLFMACETRDTSERPFLMFDFNENVTSGHYKFKGNDFTYAEGIKGKALVFDPEKGNGHLRLDSLLLDGSKDFSVQFWVKTSSNKPMVFLSNKVFDNKGIIAQKNAGWVLYSSNGTFAWSLGSEDRRINYERDNGDKMPINDGTWHQLTLTYNRASSEYRLYYDGQNTAVYKVNFEFTNNNPFINRFRQ